MRERLVRLAVSLILIPSLVGPLLAATEPESKLQKLLRQLREGDWLQRQEACLELGELSPRMLRGLARKTVEAPQGVPRDYKLLLTLARQRIHLEEGEVSEQLWREFQSGEFFLQEYATSTLGLTRGDVVSSLIELWPELEGLPRAQAVSVFRERGPEALEALPLLVELASETEDVDLLWRSALALGRVAPADPRVIDLARARLQSENTSECAAWLWVLGRAGEAGVPGLIAAMKDARLREEASARLALLGAPAFEPVLQAAAEVRSAKTRAYLLRVLGVIDPAHPEVVTRVLEACNDSSAFLRDEAFRVLGRLEMEDEQRCAILKKGLQDGSKKVRDAVREVIGNLGPQASCLALDLVRAWEQDMPTDVVETVLFSGALRLLESLSPEAASALFDLYLRAPAELDARVEVTFQATAMEWAPLAAEVFQERYEALERPVDKARGLYFLAGRGERTLQELEALLATGDFSYDTAILRCLSNEDSWTQALRDFVVESWHDDRLCMDVCLALAGGGDSVADLRSRFLADFADCSLEVQLALLGVFAKVHPDAPDYLELLVTLAEQTDVPELRVGVVEGLASGRSSPETRVSTLIALLTPEDPLRDLPGGGAHLDEDIRAAMWILAREHAAAGGLISTIFEALRSFDTLSQKQFDEIVVWAGTTHLHTQVNALRTFEKHGDRLQRWIPSFVSLMDDENHIFLQIGALKVLAAAGPEVQKVLPELAIGVCAHHAEVGYYALQAIEPLGERTRPVLPILLRALVNEQYSKAYWYRPKDEEELVEAWFEPAGGTPGYPELRAAAAELVAKIGVAHPEDISLIRPVLERVVRAGEPGAEAAQAALVRLAEVGDRR